MSGLGLAAPRWWRLAFRNLGRHRRRTLLTGSIVVVGYVATTMTAGFISQTFASLKKATIKNLGGHLRLVDPRAAGKTDDEASSLLLSSWEEIDRLVRRDPRVASSMPRLSFFGLVVRGEKSAGYLGTGTVPALEKAASLTVETVREGSFLEDENAPEVMLGGGLARALGANVGDLVTVMTTTPDGSLNAVDATVRAVLRYPIKEMDDRILFLPYRQAAALLKSEGMASMVVVLLRDDEEIDKTAAELARALEKAGRPVVLKTWLETAAFYKQVQLLYTAIFSFMGIILATVVILATANTMTMSVFERTREIGTLLAIGMERGAVRRILIREGFLMGLVGSLVGCVVSLLFRALLNVSGIELPAPPGGTSGSVLHVDFIPLSYVIGLVMMTSTLLVASWWPARRAARLNPVEALAHV